MGVEDDTTLLDYGASIPTDFIHEKDIGLHYGESAAWVDFYYDPNMSLGVGQEADFWFTTKWLPIVPMYGSAWEPTVTMQAGGTTVGPGKLLISDIDIDSDRDKMVDGDDEALEETIGTILIADKDNVYDPTPQGQLTERAKRREFKVTTPNAAPNDEVRIKRTKDNIKIFTKSASDVQGDVEIAFNANGEAKVKANGTYWLQGGDTPSKQVRETLLKVRPDDDNAKYQDTVSATVIWVEISGKSSGDLADQYTNKSGLDVYNLFVDQYGHDNRGLDFPNVPPGTTQKTKLGLATVEIIGSILPVNLRKYSPVTTITTGFKHGGVVGNTKGASADFGFVFRRYVESKSYSNGTGPALHEGPGKNDDSFDEFQDTEPDIGINNTLLISDVDAPGISTTDTVYQTAHYRLNFDEWNVFHFYSGEAERTSKVLEWSATMDVGNSTNDEPVFILGKPNDGKTFNEVNVGSQLESLNLGLTKPTITNAVNKATNSNKLQKNKEHTLTIKGTDLVGTVRIVQDTANALAFDSSQMIKYKVTSATTHYSDATEIEVELDLRGFTVGEEVKLTVKNEAGESVAYTGLEIVN